MAKYSYKVGFFTQEVDIAKEMISYKGKTIPGQAVTGIGFVFIKIGYAAVGGALGGVVGSMIANKGFSTAEVEKDMTKLPENAMGHMIITYSDGTPKQQVIRIPVSTKDENAKNMLRDVADLFKDRFVGFGLQAVIEKELKVSQKGVYIVIAIIFILMFGFIALSLVDGGGY